MKKLFKFIILFLIIIPVCVFASEEGIERMYINAKIEESGDLLVEEYFYLKGKYNGFEKIIGFSNENAFDFDSTSEYYGGSKLHNGTSVEVLEVKALEKDSSFDFSDVSGDRFYKTSEADKGDYGVYIEEKYSSKTHVFIYMPSKYKKAFYIKYRIKNMAILHDDIGELGWNILDSSSVEDIDYLKATITIPNNKDEIRVWGHGPLHGKSRIIDKEHIEVSIENLQARRAIDVRTTFDRSVITNSAKRSNVVALEKILNYEESAANRANYEREQTAKRNQNRAQEYLDSCSEIPDRYCLNELEDRYKAYIYDENILRIYNEKIITIRATVIEKEETNAKQSIELLEGSPDYYYYQTAERNISILENQELKAELTERLLKVKIIIEEQETESNNIIKNICFVAIGALAIITIFFYFKHVKNPAPTFKQKYLREIPSDISPMTLSYLFKKKISPDSISAVILQLINKKVIKEEKITKKNYKLTLVDENADLSRNERNVVNLLFINRKSITLKDAKKVAEKSYKAYLRRWEKLMDGAIEDAETEGYYENKTTVKSKNTVIEFVTALIFSIFFSICSMGISWPISLIILIVMFFKNKENLNVKYIYAIIYSTVIFILLFIAFIVAITNHFIFFGATYCLVAALCIFIMSAVIYISDKLTVKGVDERKKWKAFKNFLNDFGRLDEKELPEVSLWGDFLAFAVVLGCAKKLSKVMELRIKEFGTIPELVLNYNDFNYVTRNIKNTVKSSHSSASSARSAHSSSSSYSSGSGGGGGFSSGGGSFGGGGGGGRF